MLPKVSEMSSFTGTQKDSLIESTSPHLVICCPCCRTKFAVESSTVASLEVPRFHCSRCDTVFLMQEPTESPSLGPAHGADSGSARWVLADPAKTIENEDSVPAPTHASGLRPNEFSLGVGRWEAEPVPQEAAPPATTKPQTTTTESISMRSGLSLLDQGQTNLDSQRPAGGFAASTAPRTQLPSTKVNHRAENPLRSSSSATVIPEPTNLSEENQEILAKMGREAETGILRRLAQRLSPRSRGLIKLAIPPLASLMVLLLVSYSARISPRSTGSLLELVTPSTISEIVPQLPPNELTIRDLSLKFVRTPSRETVAVVSGKLFNASSKALEDVTLEARGFNERGETVIAAKAPLRSALGNEKVSDLERETIVKFQHALGAKDSSIAAGESVPFSVALLTPNDADETSDGNSSRLPTIKFFSARVFSVR